MNDPVFDDWVARARECSLVEAVAKTKASLKKTGTELIGPCPSCGGRDRFAINPAKGKWICRPESGGSEAIGLIMHCEEVSFLEACEILTGEKPPRGRGRGLSDEEKDAIEARKKKAQEKRKEDRRIEQEWRRERQRTAAGLWDQCIPIAGTLAEKNLLLRGIPVPPMGWPDCLGFCDSIVYDEFDPYSPMYPGLVARADDIGGDLAGVWIIFLDAKTGNKLDREPNKVGRGPAGGGAVRIGGMAARIGACEGVETGLAVWSMLNYAIPVWPLLSTSGMIGFEPPLELEHVRIFPDGDRPVRRKDGRFIPIDVPPGRYAATRLGDRLLSFGVACTLEAEPPPGLDYLDIWNRLRAMRERYAEA